MFAGATTTLPPMLVLGIGSRLRSPSSRLPSDRAQSTVTFASSSKQCRPNHLSVLVVVEGDVALRAGLHHVAVEDVKDAYSGRGVINAAELAVW
jgi:hypothetical protein